MLATPRADRSLPTGTVTFLFTDIEGSTKLWEAHPEVMCVALARHDALMRAVIEAANGCVFKTVGDAFCAAFAVAHDAVAAALEAQIALNAEPWPRETPIKVRIALHTGAVETRDDDYFGQPLNRVARLLSTGCGGQTLLSQATYELSRDSLPEGISLRDLGAHHLKDLARPEQVFELRHHGLPGDFPPIKSLSTHPNNLPEQLTSFIGRDTEIAEIEGLLTKTRVLTVTGSGGSGKTRLCLQVAAHSFEQFPDGVWFVEFAPLADPALVPQTVSTVLGLKERPGESITQTLLEHIKYKQLLLLLDNCEHLLDRCASLANLLARQCPRITILATSREPLGIAGERTYRVPSLSLPDRKQAPTPNTLSQYESVQLFIDRALLVRQDFQVSNNNAPAVASLCYHLDGIPLAIELAAARMRSLSVEEIDAKLDQRFRLLTGGSRTALPRQQTLRALIDWSYDLLRDPEKQLLQRLSVFAGGWTLAAVEAVCTDDDAEGAAALDLLTSLADKSLVLAEQTNGHSRFGMLETVHRYACERLAERGGGDAVRQRHQDYFLALAEEAEPNLKGADQAVWLQCLEAEHENLRAALDWSLTDAGSAKGVRLCGALHRFWEARGHLSEGREWCERVLRKARGDERTRERAKALFSAGALSLHQGDYPAAGALLQESLAIRREVGERSAIAASLNTLGSVAHDQGDYPKARALYEESLAIRRGLGDRGGVADSLNNLGGVAHSQGDYAGARALLEESLAIQRELGDRGGIAASLNNLGYLAHNEGDYARARALHEECLAISRELEDRFLIAASLSNMGDVAGEMRDYPAAEALFVQSLAIRRELGDQRGIAVSLSNLGNVAQEQRDDPRARVLHEESLAIRRVLGDRCGIAGSLNNLGCVAQSQRDYCAARALHEESLAIQREVGDRGGIAASLNHLGDVAYDDGDFAGSRALNEESLVIRRELGDKLGIARSLDGLAAAVAALGSVYGAARIWGAAERLREEIGSPLPPSERPRYDARLATARAALEDDAAFARTWKEGSDLTLEKAIELALEETVGR